MNDEISELSAAVEKARREGGEKRLRIPALPSHVLSIPHAEVAYTIEPHLLPFAQCDIKAFLSRMNEEYGVRIEPSGIAHSLLSMPDDKEAADTLRRLLADRDSTASLELAAGKFSLSPSDFVPIRKISLNSETIHVAVAGHSSIAEMIIGNVAEALWESAGARKTWDDLSKGVQMKSYGTATKVDFGIPLEKFVNRSFANFLNADCEAPDGFAAGMVARSRRDSFGRPPRAVATWTLDDLTAYVSVFNLQNGRSERSRLRLSVTSRDEEGAGIFTVISELPLEEHIRYLDALKSAMSE
jgi:hypothetical protein